MIHFAKLKYLNFIILFFAAFLLNACAGNSNKADLSSLQSKVESAETLYNQALSNFDAERYKEAALKFDAINTQHPLTKWARKAMLMKGYSYYCGGLYSDAITALTSYLQQNNKEDSCYATYLLGLCYFKQIPDITFDQTQSQLVVDTMQKLIKNCPHSKYIEDAKVKMRFAQSQLAEKEMRVGRFYQGKSNYVAALKRYRNVLEKYSDTALAEEALYRWVEVNYALGLLVEARTAAYVLGYNYPSSPWYKSAYDLLTKANVGMERDKDSWLYKLLNH